MAGDETPRTTSKTRRLTSRGKKLISFVHQRRVVVDRCTHMPKFRQVHPEHLDLIPVAVRLASSSPRFANEVAETLKQHCIACRSEGPLPLEISVSERRWTDQTEPFRLELESIEVLADRTRMKVERLGTEDWRFEDSVEHLRDKADLFARASRAFDALSAVLDGSRSGEDQPPELPWQDRALALIFSRGRDWTVKKLAEEVGVHRSTLYGDQRVKDALFARRCPRGVIGDGEMSGESRRAD